MGKYGQLSGIGAMMRGASWVVGLALLLSACADAEMEAEEAAITASLLDLASQAEEYLDYTKSMAYYLRLYERDPEDVEALGGYLRNMRYAGEPREAVKAAKNGIEIHGELPELLLELGKAQFAASMIQDARETFEKARQAMPGNWEVYSAMGILYDQLGLLVEAKDSYGRALELSPDNVVVLNNTALSLAQSGKLDEAIAILEKVVNSERSTEHTRQNLALLYAVRGDLESAERLSAEDLSPEAVKENLAPFRLLHQ